MKLFPKVLRKTTESGGDWLTVCLLLAPTNVKVYPVPLTFAWNELQELGWVRQGTFTRDIHMEQTLPVYLPDGILISITFALRSDPSWN